MAVNVILRPVECEAPVPTDAEDLEQTYDFGPLHEKIVFNEDRLKVTIGGSLTYDRRSFVGAMDGMSKGDIPRNKKRYTEGQATHEETLARVLSEQVNGNASVEIDEVPGSIGGFTANSLGGAFSVGRDMGVPVDASVFSFSGGRGMPSPSKYFGFDIPTVPLGGEDNRAARSLVVIPRDDHGKSDDRLIIVDQGERPEERELATKVIKELASKEEQHVLSLSKTGLKTEDVLGGLYLDGLVPTKVLSLVPDESDWQDAERMKQTLGLFNDIAEEYPGTTFLVAGNADEIGEFLGVNAGVNAAGHAIGLSSRYDAITVMVTDGKKPSGFKAPNMEVIETDAVEVEEGNPAGAGDATAEATAVLLALINPKDPESLRLVCDYVSHLGAWAVSIEQSAIHLGELMAA
jgi:hypothetical protein